MSRELPKTVPLGKVIASRTFHIKGGPKAKAELRIGLPVDCEENAYCPVQLLGIGDERVRPVWGIDTLQALQLVFRYVPPLLLQFGNRLRWEGVPAHESLYMSPGELFEDAGLSDFLSKFADLCLEQAALRTVQRRRSSRSRSRRHRPRAG